MEALNSLKTKDWNVLLITADQHNAKLMGCAGHPIIKTPALDRLASEGTLFEKAYCTYPSCAPTRQSMVTGRHPKEHGQLSDSYEFHKDNKTWAHHFGEHGYTTGCIGKMHTHHEELAFGYDHRYSAADISEEMNHKSKLNPPYHDPEDRDVFSKMTDLKYWSDKSRLYGMIASDGNLEHDGIMTNEAVRYLHEHQDEQFFLHVSLIKPHYPWISPKEYYYMYEPEDVDLPPLEPNGLEQNYMGMKKINDTRWDLNTYEQNRLCRARYYGCISWMDYNVGQILDTLEALNLTDNTLVIYSSDHGDMAGEKGLWLKTLMYDSSARVPMIIRMPGIVKAGVTNSELINHADLFPTIAGLVGAVEDLPANISGNDLSQVVRGGDDGPQYTFAMEGISEDWDVFPDQLMVRSQKWKYIHYRADDLGRRVVLYDMDNDPYENINLAEDPRYMAIFDEHHAAMLQFLESLKKPKYKVNRVED